LESHYRLVVRVVCLGLLLLPAYECDSSAWTGAGPMPGASESDSLFNPGSFNGRSVSRPMIIPPSYDSLSGVKDYLVKVAFGKTFGTSTELDYATLEFGRRLTGYPRLNLLGTESAELQMSMLASYVFYYEGKVEKIKKLDFKDGFELAWLPKGKFVFQLRPFGLTPFGECGAGLSYVSETYRNSGSRFNWSLLGGMGLERQLPGKGTLALGIQWRHLSNGNMWGKGDELHNSNSGTDMIQALATFLHFF
jgi:hypothetical protein